MAAGAGPKPFNASKLSPPHFEKVIVPEQIPMRKGSYILYTDDIRKGDAWKKNFDDAKRGEILGLIETGNFRLALREEAGPDANIIRSQFLLTIKHPHNEEPV